MIQQTLPIARLYDSFTSSCSIKRPTKPTHQQFKTKTLSAETSGILLSIKSIDVVCARGRAYWNHHGNQLYRKLIDVAKRQYSKASKRQDKSKIVSDIIHEVQEGGRFIKLVGKEKNSTFVLCEEAFIREKVTQSLRDTLSFKYSSSTKRKRVRKEKDHEIFYEDIDKIVHSNIHVSCKINSLEQQVGYVNHIYENDVPDDTMLQLFDMANLEILETIKKYREMMNHNHCLSFDNNNNNNKTPSPVLSAIIENNTNDSFDHHRNRHFETSFSSLICSSESSSVSSSYTTASSIRYDDDLTFPPNTNTITNTNYDNDCHVLDLDAPFMFLDEMCT